MIYILPLADVCALMNFACIKVYTLWSINRVSTTPGNLLEFKNPPGNLLEFTGPPGNFCVRWSTALVSSKKFGYQIAYLSRNWSPYFIFSTAPCCIKCISCDERWLELIITCSIKCSRFGTLQSRPKQRKHVLDFSWNPSWSLLEICSVKFVDTLIKGTFYYCNNFVYCQLWYKAAAVSLPYLRWNAHTGLWEKVHWSGNPQGSFSLRTAWSTDISLWGATYWIGASRTVMTTANQFS